MGQSTFKTTLGIDITNISEARKYANESHTPLTINKLNGVKLYDSYTIELPNPAAANFVRSHKKLVEALGPSYGTSITIYKNMSTEEPLFAVLPTNEILPMSPWSLKDSMTFMNNKTRRDFEYHKQNRAKLISEYDIKRAEANKALKKSRRLKHEEIKKQKQEDLLKQFEAAKRTQNSVVIKIEKQK